MPTPKAASPNKSHPLKASPLLHHLLAKGYFPQEVPACFTTELLASALLNQPSNLPTIWTQAQTKPPTLQLMHHDLARAGTLRRRLSIPHPVAHFALSSAIDKSWKELSTQINQSPISKSKPIPGKTRALETETGLNQLSEHRTHYRRRGRYILQADISQFYHSIYTHSIPWALHGKAVAKKAQKNYQLTGNILDELVRSGQDKQSIGIPIGPDSSLVLAELLMSSIDSQVEKDIYYAGAYRFVDDWEMSFTNLQRAEKGLSQLQQSLSDWELTLNPKKTKILELPLGLGASWATEISQFRIEQKGKGSRKSIIQYFDLAFRLAATHPDESVIKYATGRILRQSALKDTWDLLESLLFQSVNAEPGTLRHALEIIEKYAREGCSIDKNGLSKLLSDQIIRHAPQGHGSEVLWSLWGALRFNVGLGKQAALSVLKIQDSLVGILALDLISRGKLESPASGAWWDSLATPESLCGSHWLLSYEAGIHKFLKGWKAHIVKDPYFKFLKSAAVSFYIPVEPFKAEKNNRPTAPANALGGYEDK
ncbi:RNA-directed DNA polymerase [Corallococcus coralloides]|uniref:RNA-directed DNA polymerase n=1 Tax=Corallococcus coralloides TaxID=184914 RepID=UPI00384DE5E6